MKKIVCELCEGTQFVKENGMFICQSCGTKYSTEEVKKMMKEVEGDSQPVSVRNTTSEPPMNNVDQQRIDNLFLLASNAKEAGNDAEAENYCNQIISLDATMYKAWFLKAKAIGWQSTLQSPRISEAAYSFGQAVDFAPEDEKEEMTKLAVNELESLGIALLKSRKNLFSKYPDEDELKGFRRDRSQVLESILVLLKKGKNASLSDDYKDTISHIMNDAAVDAFKNLRTNYSKISKPQKSDLAKMIDRTDNCIALIQQSLDVYSPNKIPDTKNSATSYENMSFMSNYLMGLEAYDSYSSTYPSISLSSDAKAERRKIVNGWDREARRINGVLDNIKREQERKAAEERRARERKAAEEKKARIEAYWSEHTEEKRELEEKKADAKAKASRIRARIYAIDRDIENAKSLKNRKLPSETDLEKAEKEKDSLVSKKNSLGLFAGKEKKQLTEEITSLQGKMDELRVKIEAERKERDDKISKQIAALDKEKGSLQKELKIAEYDATSAENELTKDR